MSTTRTSDPEWVRQCLLLQRLGAWEASVAMYLHRYYSNDPWIHKSEERYKLLVNHRYTQWFNTHSEVWKKVDAEVRAERRAVGQPGAAPQALEGGGDGDESGGGE